MKKKEKIVGILGGMGPFATADFFRQILVNTPAKKDWEHLHIIIDNNVKIPSRTRAILYEEASPVPAMIESINKLADIGADFIAVPCNSAHYFYEKVIPHIKIPWLNMIEITGQALTKNKPLILGGYTVVKKKLYSKYIPNAEYLTDTENDFVVSLIEEIKITNELSKKSRESLEKIIRNYQHKTDSIILACTELPIAYKEKHILNLPLIDASLNYIKEIIKFAFNYSLPHDIEHLR